MCWGQFPNPRLVVTTVKMTVICNKLPGEMWLLMGKCSSSEGEGGKTDGNVLGRVAVISAMLLSAFLCFTLREMGASLLTCTLEIKCFHRPVTHVHLALG